MQKPIVPCCACGYSGDEETECLPREDGRHCNHWYDSGGDDERPIDEAYRLAAAKACCGRNDIQFDRRAEVKQNDNGAWVRAWVFVRDEDTDTI